MASTLAEWEDRLRAQGYRITPQRQFVLEAVSTLGHGTPEEILVEVQRRAGGVNLSTIYRTLEVLEEVGLVTHAHLGHGAPTYHSVEDEIHIHLVCSGCQAVDSVPLSTAEPFIQRLLADRGFATDAAHMSVQGVCRACGEASPARKR